MGLLWSPDLVCKFSEGSDLVRWWLTLPFAFCVAEISKMTLRSSTRTVMTDVHKGPEELHNHILPPQSNQKTLNCAQFGVFLEQCNALLPKNISLTWGLPLAKPDNQFVLSFFCSITHPISPSMFSLTAPVFTEHLLSKQAKLTDEEKVKVLSFLMHKIGNWTQVTLTFSNRVRDLHQVFIVGILGCLPIDPVS